MILLLGAGFVIAVLALADIFFSLMLAVAVRDLIHTVKLCKKGCRTNGTFVKIIFKSRGGSNCISYMADGKEYHLESGQKVGKWEVGYDKIPLLYDPECPENACLEKYDLVSVISDTVIFSLLEAVFIGSTIYTIICFI